MKKALTAFIHIIAVLLVISFFAFTAITTIRSHIVTLWSSPQKVECYRAEVLIYSAESEISIILLPENRAFFEVITTSERSPVYELSLVEIKAVYGTHIIGPLWKSHYVWDFKLVENGYKPLFAEIETLKTFILGEGKHTLPQEGRMKKSVILLGENQLKFAGITLKRVGVEDCEIETLFEMLDLPNTP